MNSFSQCHYCATATSELEELDVLDVLEELDVLGVLDVLGMLAMMVLKEPKAMGVLLESEGSDGSCWEVPGLGSVEDMELDDSRDVARIVGGSSS